MKLKLLSHHSSEHLEKQVNEVLSGELKGKVIVDRQLSTHFCLDPKGGSARQHFTIAHQHFTIAIWYRDQYVEPEPRDLPSAEPPKG